MFFKKESFDFGREFAIPRLMNKFRTIALLIATVFLLSGIMGFSQETEMNNIRISIKTGNSHGLSTLLNKTIELKTENENGTYSNTQAEFILKNFFRKHPANNFEYNHIGSSPGGAKYMIGTYKSGDQTFRVYIKLRKVNDKFLIDNMDFTKQ